jgi:uncharacterized protein
MEMTGQQLLSVAQQQAWDALNDPAILRECIPGCETVERVSATEFQLVMTTAIGPVKGKFKGKLTLTDVDAPNAYSLNFEGQGGLAGFAKGGAQVALSPTEAGTLMRYTVNAHIGGKLAQIGSRLVDGAARKMADGFFARFKAQFSENRSD